MEKFEDIVMISTTRLLSSSTVLLFKQQSAWQRSSSVECGNNEDIKIKTVTKLLQKYEARIKLVWHKIILIHFNIPESRITLICLRFCCMWTAPSPRIKISRQMKTSWYYLYHQNFVILLYYNVQPGQEFGNSMIVKCEIGNKERKFKANDHYLSWHIRLICFSSITTIYAMEEYWSTTKINVFVIVLSK